MMAGQKDPNRTYTIVHNPKWLPMAITEHFFALVFLFGLFSFY